MAEIEDKVATEIAGKIDQSDKSMAKPSAAFGPINSGSETLDSLHASSATQPLDGGTMHSGVGTKPLGPGWELPDNPAEFARARAEVKASQAATSESLRRHASGYFEPSGTISGLSKPTDNERKV